MTVVLSECLGVKWIDSSLIVQNDKGGGYELGKLYANASCCHPEYAKDMLNTQIAHYFIVIQKKYFTAFSIIIVVGIRCWTVGIDSSLITQNDNWRIQNDKKELKSNKK